MNPSTTIFLDRDGVINQDSPDYIKSWSEFHFIPGSIDAIVDLSQQGYAVIIITNQSIINRQMVPLSVLEEIHSHLRQIVTDRGGRIVDILFCPHRPDEDCYCRKPKPGLILTARDRYNINLNQAVMVGDSAKDILAGKAAGCGQTVLVKTGNGKNAIKTLEETGQSPDHMAADLNHATRWIIRQQHIPL